MDYKWPFTGGNLPCGLRTGGCLVIQIVNAVSLTGTILFALTSNCWFLAITDDALTHNSCVIAAAISFLLRH